MPAIAALFWILVWQVASMWLGQEILLASPVRVLATLWEFVGQPAFWGAVGFSFVRIAGGFLLAWTMGIFLAVVAARHQSVRILLTPLTAAVKATPVASFIILALVWIPSKNLSVFISFLMVLPIVWANVAQALAETDPLLIEMGKAFHFSGWQRVREIYIPSAMPQFLAACTTALGFAWKSGVAAEILSLPRRAVGTYLYQAKITLETVDLFAWTLCVIAFSMLMERAMMKVLRRLSHD